MCGIFFTCETPAIRSEQADEFEQLCGQLRAENAARGHRFLSDNHPSSLISFLTGPDAQDAFTLEIDSIKLSFFSSELRLRGTEPIVQPHRSSDGHIFCWNGEVGPDLSIQTENDGAVLFGLLRSTRTKESFRDVLGKIEGPYAFVYYHPLLRLLLFARDPLGRRSLLAHMPTVQTPQFVLTSSSVGAHALLNPEELSTSSIQYLDVGRLAESTTIEEIQDCFGNIPRSGINYNLPFAEPGRVNPALPNDPPVTSNLDEIPPHLSASVDDLIYHLDRSVRLQTQNVPQRRQATVSTSIQGFQLNIQTIDSAGSARVAVLFSGGIDSTVLAFLADRHIKPDEPIDLLNVAFENPRKILVEAEGNIGGLPKRERKAKMKYRIDYSSIDVAYDVPDRLTGRQEVEELRRLCPGRVWNFVEINVPYEESRAARGHVEALMYPGRTIMDLSLAVALYFAARGKGHVRPHPHAAPQPYDSPARVLLNGLGSDELLGGYGRHRAVFNAGGWPAIIEELQLEIDRIPIRNLGRDDRVISSHGKEARHPFLSLSVIAFLSQLPVHHKMDPRLAAGLGEKLLLRLAARKIGLVEASARKKRAMQFGSHSARMGPGETDGKRDISLTG
ncbi:asparagine synthase-domain-containing protein [Cristinia sonorae]|uniref:Asparagine synthase-domain-containing protein n=1 Tax=Cristinia sonorae TaxID=1940300 RepID=A0A8K0UPG8_9AGAR|nr:asparagine synthase-domain-containing protein [Cristinia sonorae]